MTKRSEAIIESPCVRLCVIEASNGLCSGCGRNLAEIAAWGAMSPAERRTVMAALPARLAIGRGDSAE